MTQPTYFILASDTGFCPIYGDPNRPLGWIYVDNTEEQRTASAVAEELLQNGIEQDTYQIVSVISQTLIRINTLDGNHAWSGRFKFSFEKTHA